MDPLQVGLLGCGNISTTYCRNASRFDHFKIVACADIDPARAETLRGEFSLARALSVEDLLADSAIDLVLNLTIPSAHGDMALAAIEAGKSVYNEKPLALRRSQARKLLRLARKKNLRVGCAPDTFLGAGWQTARQLLDAGAIGVPLATTAFMLSRGPEDWHPGPEFFYQPGGGPLFDMGPYYITALLFLLGPVRQVCALSGRGFTERQIGAGPRSGESFSVEIPTHHSASLLFASGAIGTLVTSFDVSAHQHPHLEIYGTKGTLHLHDPNQFSGPVSLRRHGSDQWEDMPLTFPYSDNSRGVGLNDLAEARQSGREHRCHGALAYHALDILHAVLDAADRGRTVTLASTMERPEPWPSGMQE